MSLALVTVMDPTALYSNVAFQDEVLRLTLKKSLPS